MNKGLKYLASNVLVLFVKLNTLHFLVKGSQFQRAHETTDNYYEYFKEVYDSINERLVQKNEMPVVNIYSIISLSKGVIKELSEEKGYYTPREVYKICLEDFTKLHKILSNLIDHFIRVGDTVTEDLLRGYNSYLEKEIWFLRAQVSDSIRIEDIINVR